MTPRAPLRILARTLALAGVLLAVIAARVVSSSHGELARAERLMSRDDMDAAILGYRRAARLYAPGNPYSTRALDRLAEIATAAEAEHDTERALAAWRAIRGAILSARSVYVPHRDRLARANDAIAALTAASGRGRPASLDPPERPRVAWTLLALFGWLAWTGGAFVFAVRALDEEDRVIPAAARLWGTVVVLGFGSFVIGLALA